MPSVMLNDKIIQNIRPGRRQTDVYDRKVRGLVLRTSPGGTTTFYVIFSDKKRRKRVRHKIGNYPIISLKDARNIALSVLGDVAKGIDIKERDRQSITVRGLLPQYIEMKKSRGQKTWKEYERILTREMVSRWGNRRPCDISSAEIRSAVDNVTERIRKQKRRFGGLPAIPEHRGLASANRALSRFKEFFRWCVDYSFLDRSPCEGVRKLQRELCRDRVLDDDELRKIWDAAINIGPPFGTVIMMLMLTGQRLREVGRLRRDAIDFERRTWRQLLTDNKSTRKHTVYLSNLAMHLLETCPRKDDTYFFPAKGRKSPLSGWSKFKIRLDELSGVQNWRNHDLRRTMKTRLLALGQPRHITELLLNHKISGSASEAAYDWYDYATEQRAAANAWSEHVESLISLTDALWPKQSSKIDISADLKSVE